MNVVRLIALLLLALVAGASCRTEAPAPDPGAWRVVGPTTAAEGSAEEPSEQAEAVEAPGDDAADEEPEEVAVIRHVIQSGDTLWGLARQHGCTIQMLRDANGFAEDLIVVGRTMIIPDCTRLRAEAPPPPEPPTEGERTYRIQPGDYLERIAAQVQCTVTELMTANGLQNDSIFAGQTLRIPQCGVDTAPGAADQDGLTPEELDALRDARAAQAVDGATEGMTYLVRGGDSLSRVASIHGCTIREIANENGLTSPNIQVGQRLLIPQCAGEGSVWDGLAELNGQAPSQPTPDPTDERSARADRTRRGERADREERTTAIQATPPSRPGGRVVRDNESLERLMRAEGFRPPSSFKAYVLEIRFNNDRSRIEQERHFSWGRTAYEASGWNPASTVKLYAAIAAYQEARRLGYSGNARITFHGASRDHEFVLNDLVRDAIVDSSNIAYNYLVSFVGFDRLHNEFFVDRWGFRTAGLRRAYESEAWMRLGWSSSFASSPRITLREGSRSRELAARSGRASTNCSAAACSTLNELGDALRRVMLQEQLPARESFGLHVDDLRALRLALRQPRSRGEEVVRGLSRSLGGDGVHFYHKAGFAGDWYSDNVYIYNPRSNRAWVVALAGRPGRSSLDSASRIIGELIASGALSGV